MSFNRGDEVNNAMDKVDRFGLALQQLAYEDSRWKSNYRRWILWNLPARTRWVNYIEAQSQSGLPIAVALVSRAMQLRLQGK